VLTNIRYITFFYSFDTSALFQLSATNNRWTFVSQLKYPEMEGNKKIKLMVPQPMEEMMKIPVNDGDGGLMEHIPGSSGLAALSASSTAGKDEFTPLASKVT